MQLSRWLAASSAAFLLLASAAVPQSAQARDMVGFSGYAPGTIVVRTGERHHWLKQLQDELAQQLERTK